VDVSKILAELRQEHQQVEELILSLERLASGGAKRRGRPPAWMVAARASAAKEEVAEKRRPGRPAGSKNKSVPA